MKHYLPNSLRALFLSLAVLLSLPMLAIKIDGINYRLFADRNEATVIENYGSKYQGEIVIPESVVYEGTVYSVTSIDRLAFNCCGGLTSVTIPNTITSIGDGAFQGCNNVVSAHISNLEAWCNIDFGTYNSSPLFVASHFYINGEEVMDLVIPNGVTSIKDYAFASFNGTSVTIPNSVTSIGDYAFSSCSGLTSVTIPNSVTSIGDRAFYWCDGLTSVTIGNSVESIGNYAFEWCSGLTSVTIPNSVTTIGIGTFSHCHGLTSVTIPNSVTSIGSYAFENCPIASIIIPSSVVNIGMDVFRSCEKLPVENNVRYADKWAVGVTDKSLKTYVLKDNTVAIVGTFDGCTNLTSVTIPNSVTSISGGFSGCSGLTSVTIPNSVKSIEGQAFYGCSGLTSVTIPNSVTSIGEFAFWGCSGLTSVTIPNSVTSIGHGAFLSCSGLTSVTIPNSVTSIGSNAFDGCSGLTSVTIPNSVESIGSYAFYECSGLTSVTIGNSVESIGDDAFRDCPELLDVYCYAEKVPSTKSNAFNGSYPENATLHIPAGSLDSYKATEPWSSFENIVALSTGTDGINYEFDAETKQATVIKKSSGKYSGEVVIPESVEHEGATYSVTSIGYGAFSNCSGLTSVTIPNSVTSIGDYAFYACSRLISVTIGNSVTSIGGYAFDGCSALTTVHISDIAAWCNIDFWGYYPEYANPLYYANHLYVNGEEVKDLVIPNSVTSIGGYAFYDCSSLTSVTIPNSVTSIGDYAFWDCDGLTSVTIGNSVKNIGEQAFRGCRSLTSVIIPNSVTSIGEKAFLYCHALTSLTIGRGVESIGESAFSSADLFDVYCYAKNVPFTEDFVFDGSTLKNATLHVPNASVDSYKASAPWSDFGKIVAISESTSDLVIKDGESFENTEERELGTLTYTRTLPNRYWNPLYVPFKIPYEALKDNYDVAYINSMHSYDNDQNGEIDKMTMEVILVKNGVLKANHPYLIRAKSDNAKKMELVLEDVTLYPTVSNKLDCSSVYTRFEITGTYKAMKRADLNGSLVITTDGAWMELSESSELKPFRFYLTITDRPGSPLEVSNESKSRINICVQGEDDFSTGIEETENGKVNSENSAIYDLSGRRVQKAQKGIFIQNGKVMVK